MGTGYQRADVSNQITNGNTVDADVLDLEFDAVEAAFNSTSGHTHDGTTAEGGPITKTGPTQDFTHNALWLEPKLTNTIDIGSTAKRFKDGWFQGILTAVGGFVGNLTGNASTATALETSRTINGVSFDGTANINVNTNQALTAGDGLSSTGTFNGETARTFAVDATVVRTSGNQTVGGVKTFSSTIQGNISGNAGTVTNGVYTTRTLTAGNGLTGGGTLASDRTFTLGTPTTLNGSTTNAVTSTSHTHAISNTSSRVTDSTDTLLNAKAMVDHIASGDHDGRYARLAANNTFTFTQSGTIFSANDGSATIPTFRFNDDINTGFYRTAGGNIGATSNGVLAAQVDPAGTSISADTSVVTREKGDNRYLQLTGGSLSNGLGFGATAVASATDLSRHISLHSGGYGLSVTANRLNLLSPSTVDFYSGSVLSGRMEAAGTSMSGATSVVTREKGDSRYVQQTDLTRTTSGEIVLTAAGAYTWAHGIGSRPNVISIFAVNRAGATRGGWADGESILLVSGPDNSDSGNYISIQPDNTNVVVVFTGNLIIPNKGAVGAFVATYSEWRIIIHAIRIA